MTCLCFYHCIIGVTLYLTQERFAITVCSRMNERGPKTCLRPQCKLNPGLSGSQNLSVISLFYPHEVLSYVVSLLNVPTWWPCLSAASEHKLAPPTKNSLIQREWEAGRINDPPGVPSSCPLPTLFSCISYLSNKPLQTASPICPSPSPLALLALLIPVP